MSNRSAGFTAIELVIAIVMIGTMLAVALPRTRDALIRESVRGARNAVAVQFSQARGAATTRACPAVVHVQPGTAARSWVTACGTNGAAVDTVGTVMPLSMKYGVIVVSSLDSVTFTPQGLAVTGTWSSLVFSKGGAVDTLLISPLGRVAP